MTVGSVSEIYTFYSLLLGTYIALKINLLKKNVTPPHSKKKKKKKRNLTRVTNTKNVIS